MARELSQEAVLDFLWAAGGRAPNTALLRHFQRFLRDPALTEQQRRERREYFKSLVNSLATVRPAASPGASKDIVLRRRYRDLLDEELPPPDGQREKEEEEEKEKEPPPRRDPDWRRSSPGDAEAKGHPVEGQLPGTAVAGGGCAARGRGGPCCECRRARRAAAATPPGPGTLTPAQPRRSRSPLPPKQPPPYRTRPLSSSPGTLTLAGPPRSPPPPAQPPPYRTRPLSSSPWTLHTDGSPRSQPLVLPSGPGVLPPAQPPPPARSPPYQPLQPPSARPTRSPPPGPGVLPSAVLAPLGPQSLQCPREPPPSQSLSQHPGVLHPDRLPQPHSVPQTPTAMPLLKVSPPVARPRQQAPTKPPLSPPLSLGPRVLSLTELPLPVSPQPPLVEPPPSRSLSLLSTPGVLPLSRSLQALPASSPTSSPLLSGLDVLPSTQLPPSQSRSLQQLPTRPSPSPSRGCRVLTPNGPTQSQTLLLHPYQTLPLPSGPRVLSSSRTPPSQSSLQYATQALSSLQPPPARLPPSQSLLPVQGSQVLESSPPEQPRVFRSIRCQLALLEVQGITPSLQDDCGRQPCTMPSKSFPRNVPSRVPLGQREHAWLVAVSAGSWARVRELFLEEPELALQRDFMTGFTVLHWLAKHGDGPGLQELAEAARQAGLALDVDARSGCGYTPLHLAAIHGHQLVIKVLVLQMGCQVQVRDGSGRRPWQYLGSSTSGEIWQLLEAPRGTIMFSTQPLAHSMSSVSKVSPSAGRSALPACLRPQHGCGAASHRTGSESD
ncbi:ankyrin repeat domain-containing protein SOWAHB [Porphyrio hochstetteri]